MPGAVTGSSAVSPARSCPLLTVSRWVPSLAISFSTVAWEEAARPRTATIAATPIAMPSADSPARSLRVRSPIAASPARSPGRIAGSCVGDDVPVEHLDAAAGPGGDRLVVGDDDDRGALLVEFLKKVKDRGTGRGVEVPCRLVGQHHRRAA